MDCENSDPYRLCAALKTLEPERLEKVERIILFDDINAASAWEMLEAYVDIPVEYISLVYAGIIGAVCGVLSALEPDIIRYLKNRKNKK